jgi:hypothetical protein
VGFLAALRASVLHAPVILGLGGFSLGTTGNEKKWKEPSTKNKYSKNTVAAATKPVKFLRMLSQRVTNFGACST